MITKHAKKRLKQRQGVNKGDLNKIVRRALAEGIKHCEAKGRLRSWMDSEYLKYQTANNCRYYAHKLYIFSGTKLITILDADDEMDDNLREYTDNDRIYIKYRINRFSRKKDPSIEKSKLITELNTYIPQIIEQKFKEYEIVGEFADAIVQDNLTVRVRYVPIVPIDEKKLNKLKGYVNNQFGLDCTINLVYSVALPISIRKRGKSFNYLIEEYGIDSDLLSYLYIRKDYYESREHYIVFVGSDKYHFPKSASIYTYADGEELFYLRDAVGSSDEYTFSIINDNRKLCIFPSEIEALSYISNMYKEVSEIESVLVIKDSVKALSKYLEAYPNTETIVLYGEKLRENNELVRCIKDTFGEKCCIIEGWSI